MKDYNNALAYLATRADDLAPATRNLLSTVDSKGKSALKLEAGEVYVAAEVPVGGGEKEMLPSGIDRNPGITNFDGNKLKDQRNIIVKKIQLGYDASQANSGKADVLKYANAPSGDVLGAELRVSQDGTMVYQAPLSSFFPQGTAQSVAELDVELDAYFMLIEGKTTAINVVFPASAQAHATNKEYLKATFKGWETKRR